MNLFDALAARATGEAAVLVPRPVSRFAPGIQSAGAAATDAVPTAATVSPDTSPPPRRYRPADEPPRVAAEPLAAPTPIAVDAGPRRGSGDGLGDPRRSAVTPRAEPGPPDVDAPEPRRDGDRAGRSGGASGRARVARGPRNGATWAAPTPHEQAPTLPPIATLLARSLAAPGEPPVPTAIEPVIRPGDREAMGPPRGVEPAKALHPSTAPSTARRPAAEPHEVPPLLVARGPQPVPAASPAGGLREGAPTISERADGEADPVIEITIGRVEVRAVTAPDPKPKAAPSRPRVSLEDYLHRRPGQPT